MKITGDQVIDAARQYVGTKFHHQGRLRFHGLDCIGLLVVVAQDLDIPIKDVRNYRRVPDGKTLIKHLDEQLDKVEPAELFPGAIVVFWYSNKDKPQHVAFYTGEGIIHTHAGVGRVLESPRLSEAWRRRIHSVYSYREVI